MRTEKRSRDQRQAVARADDRHAQPHHLADQEQRDGLSVDQRVVNVLAGEHPGVPAELVDDDEIVPHFVALPKSSEVMRLGVPVVRTSDSLASVLGRVLGSRHQPAAGLPGERRPARRRTGVSGRADAAIPTGSRPKLTTAAPRYDRSTALTSGGRMKRIDIWVALVAVCIAAWLMVSLFRPLPGRCEHLADRHRTAAAPTPPPGVKQELASRATPTSANASRTSRTNPLRRCRSRTGPTAKRRRWTNSRARSCCSTSGRRSAPRALAAVPSNNELGQPARRGRPGYLRSGGHRRGSAQTMKDRGFKYPPPATPTARRRRRTRWSRCRPTTWSTAGRAAASCKHEKLGEAIEASCWRSRRRANDE